MRKMAFLLSFLFAAGCSQNAAMVTDLQLGMQIFEVREIHKKDLTPIGFETRQGYDLVRYRGWFYAGTEQRSFLVVPPQTKPYKLTFQLYPPVTRMQCQYLAAVHNVTDPNELAEVYSIEGLRPSRLIEVKLDETALLRLARRRHVRQTASSASSDLKIDVYGPGIHMNQYGQPVTVCPDWGGIPGEQLKIRQDAYGPGVHMDQYGRPTREYPWP